MKRKQSDRLTEDNNENKESKLTPTEETLEAGNTEPKLTPREILNNIV